MKVNYTEPFNFKPIPCITPLDNYWQNGTWKFGSLEITPDTAYQPSFIDIILKGNTALTLVNAKANSLEYLKLFGGTEQRNLPSGYTEYEYLRSSGTQYIDLGYKGKGNTKVEIKFRYYQTSSETGSGRVFGSRDTSTSNAFAIGSTSGVVANTGNKIFWCYDGQSFYIPDNTFALDEWQTVVFSATEHTINGATKGDDYTVTTFETPDNLKLFAFDSGGTNSVGYVDIAYCKLWDDDGTLVRDLVPAKYGTTYGMYDKVSNTLLPNAGTGDFTAGSDAVPTPDYPVDIVCNNGVVKYGQYGKNSFDMDWLLEAQGWTKEGNIYSGATTYLYNKYKIQNGGFPITFIPNTQYTFSATIGSNNGSARFEFIYTDNTYTNIKCTANQNITVTSTSGKTLKTVSFNYGSNATFEVSNIQVELGTTATTYEPYHFGLHVDGTTETVNVTGKNLFDSSNAVNGYINSSGNVVNSQQVKTSNFIKITPSTTYTISGTGNLASASFDRYAFTYTSDKTPIEQVRSVSGGGSATFTTASNAEYIKVQCLTTNIDTCQLEQGSTATTYEPYYNGGSATAQNLFAVGTYKDVQEVLTGAVTRNVGVYVFDGTETLGIANATFIAQIRDKILSKTPLWCSHFEYSTKTSSQVEDFKIISFASRNIGFRYDACDNKTAFSNWLKSQYENETPVIIVYPLAESTTETVTPQPLNIQAGTNIVEISQASIDGLELEVKYKAGVEVTIEEIEDAQLSNDVTVTIS